jgi:hypothetical protein
MPASSSSNMAGRAGSAGRWRVSSPSIERPRTVVSNSLLYEGIDEGIIEDDESSEFGEFDEAVWKVSARKEEEEEEEEEEDIHDGGPENLLPSLSLLLPPTSQQHQFRWPSPSLFLIHRSLCSHTRSLTPSNISSWPRCVCLKHATQQQQFSIQFSSFFGRLIDIVKHIVISLISRVQGG